MAQSVNYITRLNWNNKLQDNIEIKNSGQVKQREHKNTHHASYTCAVLKAGPNRNLLTCCSFDNTMAAVD